MNSSLPYGVRSHVDNVITIGVISPETDTKYFTYHMVHFGNYFF